MPNQRTISELLVEAAARIEAMARLQGVFEAQKPFVKELLEASSDPQRGRRHPSDCGLKPCPAAPCYGEHK